MSKEKKKKAKNRRSSTKNPGLKKRFNLKSRIELIDYDYLDKLNEEELDFLNRFTEESISANFNHGGERVHKTKEQELDAYSRNNARNRCLYTKAKSKNDLMYIDDLIVLNTEFEDEELKIVDNIDNSNNDTNDE